MSCKYHFSRALAVVVILVLALSNDTFTHAQYGGGSYFTKRQDSSISASPVQATVVPGGPGFHQVNVYDFIPENPNVLPLAHELQFGYNQTESNNFYVAPVSLPNGVTITKIVLFYKDNDPGMYANVEVSFGRIELLTNTGELMALKASSGADPAFNYFEIAPWSSPIVDLQSYAYICVIQLPPSPSQLVGFTGVRIDYSYPSYLPAIQR